MWVFFSIPQCEITSRPTGGNRLRFQWSKPVSLIFLWSTLLATIRAERRTTTASPLFGFTCVQSCITACIWEHNENWHQPDYNYPHTLSISVQFTHLSARGFFCFSVPFYSEFRWILSTSGVAIGHPSGRQEHSRTDSMSPFSFWASHRISTDLIWLLSDSLPRDFSNPDFKCD